MAAAAAPEKLQEMAAKGIAPGVRPAELLALLVVFSSSEREGVRAAAQKTLAALPDQLVNGALSADLQPAVIDALARACLEKREVLDKLLAMPRVHLETVEEVARGGSEAVTELIATNESRLLGHPRIIELLYLNKHTRMSTADRLIDLAVRNGVVLSGIPAFREAAAALQGELIPEASEEPTPDDLLFQETEQIASALENAPEEDTHHEDEEGKETLKDKYVPLYQRLANMTMSQKIRRAMLGSKEERMLLVRDSNQIVAGAAIRSPLMQENEIVLISRNKNIGDEVLRVISSKPEWLKSYTVKKNLVENPKTPVPVASRLVQHLREADLKNVAKSKNVTGPVKDAARRHTRPAQDLSEEDPTHERARLASGPGLLPRASSTPAGVLVVGATGRLGVEIAKRAIARRGDQGRAHRPRPAEARRARRRGGAARPRASSSSLAGSARPGRARANRRRARPDRRRRLDADAAVLLVDVGLLGLDLLQQPLRVRRGLGAREGGACAHEDSAEHGHLPSSNHEISLLRLTDWMLRAPPAISPSRNQGGSAGRPPSCISIVSLVTSNTWQVIPLQALRYSSLVEGAHA